MDIPARCDGVSVGAGRAYWAGADAKDSVEWAEANRRCGEHHHAEYARNNLPDTRQHSECHGEQNDTEYQTNDAVE